MGQVSGKSEFGVVGALSLLYVFRMLGLFMVFPVMMVHGAHLQGATPALLGLALGCYGFTQAIFQIPLGMLSDQIGRKTVLAIGLTIFILGSVVAALSDSVWGLILGRALQGAGAIASALMALVGDLTSEKNRTKAMAMIGISIGLSFTVAISVGPVIADWGGLSAIFWVSAILASVGMLVLFTAIPTVSERSFQPEHKGWRKRLLQVSSDRHLLRLDFGIFALHFVLSATFVALPIQFEAMGVATNSTYLWVMLCAFVLMMPFMYLSERRGKLKGVFLGAVALIAASQFVFVQAQVKWQWIGVLLLFFVAFNLLEATLPSLVSKMAPAGSKGAAMGVYSTCQFLGAALGGACSGVIYSHYGASGVFVLGGTITLLWLLVAIFMRAPKKLSSIVLKQKFAFDDKRLLDQVPGVVEASWVQEQALLYLKVDQQNFDQKLLDAFLERPVQEAVRS